MDPPPTSNFPPCSYHGPNHLGCAVKGEPQERDFPTPQAKSSHSTIPNFTHSRLPHVRYTAHCVLTLSQSPPTQTSLGPTLPPQEGEKQAKGGTRSHAHTHTTKRKKQGDAPRPAARNAVPRPGPQKKQTQTLRRGLLPSSLGTAVAGLCCWTPQAARSSPEEWGALGREGTSTITTT